jgi:hypothetical protein
MLSSTDLNAMEKREISFSSRNSNPDCSAVQQSGSLVVTGRQAQVTGRQAQVTGRQAQVTSLQTQVTEQELCGLRDISNTS